MVVSYFVLAGRRDAMAALLSARVEGYRARAAARAAAEDAAADRLATDEAAEAAEVVEHRKPPQR
jgi:hypothetical protein